MSSDGISKIEFGSFIEAVGIAMQTYDAGPGVCEDQESAIKLLMINAVLYPSSEERVNIIYDACCSAIRGHTPSYD